MREVVTLQVRDPGTVTRTHSDGEVVILVRGSLPKYLRTQLNQHGKVRVEFDPSQLTYGDVRDD